MVVNLYRPYTQFPRNVRLSHRRLVTFLLLHLINTLTYLLTYLRVSC